MTDQAALAKDLKAVMAAIRSNRRFTVSAHLNPEGDALGSALALASLLKRLGKSAVVVNDGGLPAAFRFFPRLVPVMSGATRVPADVAMTVDVPVLSRTGSVRKLIEKTKLIINIDHHVSNQRFGHINWVDGKAAAAGEMVWRLYQAFRVKPTRDEAFCLYVALVTDTGSFKYMNTTPEVHRMAAQLLSTGVSPLEVSQRLYESHSVSDLKFLGKVLSSMRHSAGGKIAWLEIPRRLVKASKAGPEILDELVNYPRSVQSAEVAFVMREDAHPGKTRVSFRSKGRIDVNRLARHFGGGGHRAASGCTVLGNIPQARAKVLKVVKASLRS